LRNLSLRVVVTRFMGTIVSFLCVIPVVLDCVDDPHHG